MTGTGAFAIAHGFVAEQQGTPGEGALTLVQFDSNDPYEVIHDAVPIGKVPELRGPKWRLPAGTGAGWQARPELRAVPLLDVMSAFHDVWYSLHRAVEGRAFLVGANPCAVERRTFLAGANPARQLSFQPEAARAVYGGDDMD